MVVFIGRGNLAAGCLVIGGIDRTSFASPVASRTGPTAALPSGTAAVAAASATPGSTTSRTEALRVDAVPTPNLAWSACQGARQGAASGFDPYDDALEASESVRCPDSLKPPRQWVDGVRRVGAANRARLGAAVDPDGYPFGRTASTEQPSAVRQQLGTYRLRHLGMRDPRGRAVPGSRSPALPRHPHHHLAHQGCGTAMPAVRIRPHLRSDAREAMGVRRMR